MKSTGLMPASRVQLPERVTLADLDLTVLIWVWRLRNRRAPMLRRDGAG